jgi:DNA-binding response OmpR family regulator
MYTTVTMSGDDGADTTVLVVDDEEPAADTFASALSPNYDVRTAYSGEEALETVDDDVDVVLLDRRMPEMPGDEVLAEMQRRKLACRVAMVTAVNPDFDILSLGFDDYVVKPVGKDELYEVVHRLETLDALDEAHQELSALKVKLNVLTMEKPDAELANSEEYARLEERIEALESEVERIESEAATPDPAARHR